MKYPKSNLHTHTCFCDGKDTPREIVLTALDAGMETLGFSGHSNTPFFQEASMTQEGEERYRSEILALKEEFGDKLLILLGIEQDFYSKPIAKNYDYVIGSVHYVKAGEEYLPVDYSPERFYQIVREYYRGDVYRFVSAYYETVAKVVDCTGCDIVGHFDLITKFNEDNRFFDESDPRYLGPAMDALDVLLQKDVIFEINTGAMSRGYRRTPYPSPIFLHRIAEKRGRVTLSSDAHAKGNLLYGFDEALRFARAGGLGGIAVYTKQGWKDYPL